MPLEGYTAADIAALIPGAHKAGDGFRARCPAHGGEGANLSIVDSREGVIVKCFSRGCGLASIKKALGLDAKRRSNGHVGQRTVYDYVDKNGNVVHQTVINRQPDGSKKCSQRRPHPTKPDEFTYNLKDITPVLFRLPQLIEAVANNRTVLLVEGEKCAEAAERLGYVGTTYPMGAGKWKSHYNNHLQAAHVVILPDNDSPGRKHADQVARSIQDLAASVKIVELPELPQKGDIVDWIASGGTKEQLDALIANAPIIGKDTINDVTSPKNNIPYQRNKSDAIRETQANYELMLQHEPTWKGRLRYDEFLQQEELDGIPVTSRDRSRITSWASHSLGLTGSATKLRDQAIEVVSSESSYDSLKQYLLGIPEWDKVERLPCLFERYYGVASSEYTQWCGRMLFTGMITRGLKPGAMMRYVVVLCGGQDIGKSESVRSIGGEWTTELSANLDSRDAQIQLKGVWLVELGELNSIRKSHAESVNRFLSARFDEYTLKHKNDAVKHPRRCVFIGTSNRDDFLRDPTGSTRWFPVAVTKADCEGLARDRDMLFAEALAWYREHQSDWWIIPPAVMSVLESTRENNRDVNPYEESLAQWIKDTSQTKLTWPVIADKFLEIPKDRQGDKVKQNLITEALKAIGWKRGARERGDNGVRVYPWSPPEDVSPAVPSCPQRNLRPGDSERF